ncbi:MULTISPECIES: SUKH-3 domain-containing protein [Kitasatospora]|uniref:Uncharacterized protein n=1 Tax=Kitasatospora cystarginea TaxID=58350 RepID=A0ABP5RJQ1_9ACTN
MSGHDIPNGLRTALANAGWTEDRDATPTARRWLLETMATTKPTAAFTWQLFPQAQHLLSRYAGLTLRPIGPGAEVAARGCVIDPREARHAGAAFASLAQLVDSAVFPIGSTEGSPLAVDAHGRLFLLNHAGWWFLGADPLEGLARLVEGFAPARVSSQGRWLALAPLPQEVYRRSRSASSHDEPDPLGALLRTAMVTAYELRRCQLITPRMLRLVALGGERPPRLDREYPLGAQSLDQHAAEITADARLPQTDGHQQFQARLSGPGGWDCLVTQGTGGDQEVVLRRLAPQDAAADASAAVAAFAAAIDSYAVPCG